MMGAGAVGDKHSESQSAETDKAEPERTLESNGSPVPKRGFGSYFWISCYLERRETTIIISYCDWIFGISPFQALTRPDPA